MSLSSSDMCALSVWAASCCEAMPRARRTARCPNSQTFGVLREGKCNPTRAHYCRPYSTCSLRITLSDTKRNMELISSLAQDCDKPPMDVMAAVRAESATLHSVCTQIHDGTTDLMNAVDNVLHQNRWNIWAVGVILQFQAKNLHESCFPTFFFLCRKFISALKTEDAIILHKERKFISYRRI